MVLLDFDEKGALANWTNYPDANDWMADVEVPVRLRIANVDLLGWERGWGDGWLDGWKMAESIMGIRHFFIHFAWWGLVALKQAKLTGGSSFSLGMYGDNGELVFKMQGEDVLVHFAPNGKTVKVGYEKLEHAWHEFADRVRGLLLREFPDVRSKLYYSPGREPGWQEWLAGEEKADLPITRGIDIGDITQDDDGFEHIDAEDSDP
jgi:hypothetical protein